MEEKYSPNILATVSLSGRPLAHSYRLAPINCGLLWGYTGLSFRVVRLSRYVIPLKLGIFILLGAPQRTVGSMGSQEAVNHGEPD